MFYTFYQSNSGGKLIYNADDGISGYVIIEAETLEEAIYKAKQIGLYFDGVENGSDCSCCGDRWYDKLSTFDIHLKPTVSGQVISPGAKWQDRTKKIFGL